MNILFRCDAAPDIGFGHVSRCLALAKVFQKNYPCKISFAMRRGDEAISQVRAIHPILESVEGSEFNYVKWLKDCIAKTHSDILILDVRDGLTKDDLASIKHSSIAIVTIDDPEDKRISTDLAFYPPVPQVEEMDWSGYKGQRFMGWEYVIIDRDLDQHSALLKVEETELFISMGWSDPAQISFVVLEALKLIVDPIKIVLVIGGGFSDKNELKSAIEASHHKISVLENPENLLPYMKKAELAVLSFGVTAYEAVCSSIPSILVCLSDDHARSASSFHKAGVGLNMGVYGDITPSQLTETIKCTLNNDSLLCEMSNAAAALNCGDTHLIVEKIIKHLDNHA